MSYSILKELCQIRNDQVAFFGSEDPITNRVKYIISKLPAKPNIDVFDAISQNMYYANIELSFDAGAEYSIIFVAHHDVVNIYSDNCMDNSASVANLISLADYCSKNKFNKNIHIVFTDCEEFGGRGSKRLAKRINDGIFGKVEYVVNLELTACGTKILCEETGSRLCSILKDDGVIGVNMPFNDSVILRSSAIDSVCITILPESEFDSVIRTGYCDIWSLCHSKDDIVGNANEDDINSFMEYLYKIACR